MIELASQFYKNKEQREEVLENAEKAKESLDAAVDKLFVGKFRNITKLAVGNLYDSLGLAIYETKSANPTQLELANAKSLRLKMGLGVPNKFRDNANNLSFSWEVSVMAQTRHLKFRKVSGKTPEEATKKLIKWLEKAAKEWDNE